jgi:hypothetical protein
MAVAKRLCGLYRNGTSSVRILPFTVREELPNRGSVLRYGRAPIPMGLLDCSWSDTVFVVTSSNASKALNFEAWVVRTKAGCGRSEVVSRLCSSYFAAI